MATPAERRREPRTELDLPAKLHDPVTGRYLPARSVNTSPSGAMLRIDWPAHLHNGSTIRVAIASHQQQPVIESRHMQQAVVLRSLALGDTLHVAVRYADAASQQLANAG